MFRTAEERDTSQIKDLWAYCFHDMPEFIDFFFQACYQPQNTIIALDGDKVCSSLQLLPYRIQLRGRLVDACYIVGVSTWPEYRGRGFAARLLQYADELLRQRGIHYSILLPFQYAFYRKYGWEICYDLLTYREMEIVPGRSRITGWYKKIDPGRDINTLSECYLQFMNRFHGFVVRNRENWQKTIRDAELDHGTGYLYQQDDETLGYILYTIDESVLYIKELIYLVPMAKDALLQLAFSHIGQVGRICWKAPSSDTTYLNMKDSRGRLEKEAFVMARIHNPAGALSGLPFSSTSFVLKVTDPVYSNSNGCFRIYEEKGVSAVSVTAEEPDIEIDIRTLTQLLWGYLPVPLALAEGNLNLIRNTAKESPGKSPFCSLQALFPPRDNFMAEEY
jgi:predicted acetyltransferase